MAPVGFNDTATRLHYYCYCIIIRKKNKCICPETVLLRLYIHLALPLPLSTMCLIVHTYPSMYVPHCTAYGQNGISTQLKWALAGRGQLFAWEWYRFFFLKILLASLLKPSCFLSLFPFVFAFLFVVQFLDSLGL